jgi:transposase
VSSTCIHAVVHVAGSDEWAWRKGMNYGTIIVDLERRQVVDLLAGRSAATTADWFQKYPEIEIVSRDRAGLYAAARQGAPQARLVADRFHLLKNLRETIERQLGRFEASIRESPLQAEMCRPQTSFQRPWRYGNRRPWAGSDPNAI